MTPFPAAMSTLDRPAGSPLNGDTPGRRTPSVDPDSTTTLDGGLWRGPTEGHWIARLLHGAPAPRDPTPTPPPLGRLPRD